jgi:hypothetical protein
MQIGGFLSDLHIRVLLVFLHVLILFQNVFQNLIFRNDLKHFLIYRKLKGVLTHGNSEQKGDQVCNRHWKDKQDQMK